MEIAIFLQFQDQSREPSNQTLTYASLHLKKNSTVPQMNPSEVHKFHKYLKGLWRAEEIVHSLIAYASAELAEVELISHLFLTRISTHTF